MQNLTLVRTQKGEPMTKEERIKIYDEATELWGIAAQFDQLTEEMAELIVALNKYKRKHIIGHEYKNDPRIEENLFEEMADVSMCLEQMSLYFGEKKVQTVMDLKLKKLSSLIAKIKEKN